MSKKPSCEHPGARAVHPQHATHPRGEALQPAQRAVDGPLGQLALVDLPRGNEAPRDEHACAVLEEVDHSRGGGGSGVVGGKGSGAERAVRGRSGEGKLDGVLAAERGVDEERKEGGLEGEREEVGFAELGGEEVAGIGENDGEEVAEGPRFGGDGDGEEGLLGGQRGEHQEDLHLELGVLAGEKRHAVLRGLGDRGFIPAADHQPELDVHAADHAIFKCTYGVLSGNSNCARYSELHSDCLWWVTADRKMPPLTTGKQGNDCNCARNTALYTDINSK